MKLFVSSISFESLLVVVVSEISPIDELETESDRVELNDETDSGNETESKPINRI